MTTHHVYSGDFRCNARIMIPMIADFAKTSVNVLTSKSLITSYTVNENKLEPH